ncbi:MAG: AtzE family amidohydrolase [Alphaproteobacteria bacterium]
MTVLLQTAGEIARAVRAGEVKAAAVLDEALARQETVGAKVNAFTEVTTDRARGEAAAVDEAVAAGRDPGPLAGVPFAVKNLVDIAGVSTLAGSRINADDAPKAADAPLIARLNAAGGVLLGALNMGEYAYDFTGENSHYQPSRNPWDTDHMTGGSSGGSGAAVASGLVPLALGSDTNGSIRVPSAFCGLFGLKPTYGRLTRAGSFLFVAALDHLGPFARSPVDLALAYDVMQGPDPADPVCAQKPAEAISGELAKGADGLRIAVADGYFEQNAVPAALEAVAKAAKALGVDRRVTIPEAARARAAAYVITTAEAGNLHLKRLRERPLDYDGAVNERLMAGALAPANWVFQAQRFRSWYRDRVREVFKDVDVILTPATPIPAPRIGQKTMMLDGNEVPVRAHIGIYTQPISFIGLPVAVAPVHGLGPLPFGVQVIAPAWREDLALRVAAELERSGVASAPVAPL